MDKFIHEEKRSILKSLKILEVRAGLLRRQAEAEDPDLALLRLGHVSSRRLPVSAVHGGGPRPVGADHANIN